MGMTVQATELIIDKLIILITYFTVVPVVGYFRAWVAQKMGDDTPEQLGFLTLNPLAHVSYFWLLIMGLDIVPFGFGKYVSLNPHNYRGKFRFLKMLAAYLSDAGANIVMALIALFCFVLFLGGNALEFFGSFSQARTVAFYPGYQATTSFVIVIALFLRKIVIFNSMLAAFNIIVNLFYVGFFNFYEKKYNGSSLQSADHVQWIMFVGPLILLLLFVHKIRILILWSILTIGMWFSHLITLVS